MANRRDFCKVTLRIEDEAKLERARKYLKRLGVEAQYTNDWEYIPYPEIIWDEAFKEQLIPLLRDIIAWWDVPQSDDILHSQSNYIAEKERPRNMGISCCIGWCDYPILVFEKPYGNDAWTEEQVDFILDVIKSAGGQVVKYWNGVGCGSISIALSNPHQGVMTIATNYYKWCRNNSIDKWLSRGNYIIPPAPWH